MEISVEFSQKATNRTTIGPRYTWAYAQGTLSLITGIVVHPPSLLLYLLTVGRKWSQPRCLSTSECIGRMSYIYTKEIYLAIKKNEICRKMGGTEKYYIKIDNPHSERQIPHVLYHMPILPASFSYLRFDRSK